MRKLKSSDLFAFARCIKNIGIKEEIQKVAKESNTVGDIWEKGFDLIYSLFEKAIEKKSEGFIYEFLSGPFEMTSEEVENMDLLEMMEGVSQLADFKTWKAFFTTAAH